MDLSRPQFFPVNVTGRPAHATPHLSVVAKAVYGLLDPLPFGFFVAALIFDAVYARSGVMLWGKGGAWLITFGLLFAVIPRLINLVQVWVTSRRTAMPSDKLAFWLNLFAIAAAIVNAFVHSRDAYAIVPAAVWLSACTVVLLAAARLVVAVQHSASRDFV
jgi:uncharacterized membrane protein